MATRSASIFLEPLKNCLRNVGLVSFFVAVHLAGCFPVTLRLTGLGTIFSTETFFPVLFVDSGCLPVTRRLTGRPSLPGTERCCVFPAL